MNYKKLESLEETFIEIDIAKIIGSEQDQGFINFNKAIIKEGLFTEKQIINELKNPNYKSIVENEIRLRFPKKWERFMDWERKKGNE